MDQVKAFYEAVEALEGLPEGALETIKTNFKSVTSAYNGKEQNLRESLTSDLNTANESVKNLTTEIQSLKQNKSETKGDDVVSIADYNVLKTQFEEAQETINTYTHKEEVNAKRDFILKPFKDAEIKLDDFTINGIMNDPNIIKSSTGNGYFQKVTDPVTGEPTYRSMEQVKEDYVKSNPHVLKGKGLGTSGTGEGGGNPTQKQDNSIANTVSRAWGSVK